MILFCFLRERATCRAGAGPAGGDTQSRPRIPRSGPSRRVIHFAQPFFNLCSRRLPPTPQIHCSRRSDASALALASLDPIPPGRAVAGPCRGLPGPLPPTGHRAGHRFPTPKARIWPQNWLLRRLLRLRHALLRDAVRARWPPTAASNTTGAYGNSYGTYGSVPWMIRR